MDKGSYYDLRNPIISEEYITNINQIKSSVKKIWKDAPIIIPEFTDHGFDHSERLIDLTNFIINSNQLMRLSANEIYLLIISIFLHDIGMQCDLNNYPEIKKLLTESYGVELSLEFSADSATSYSTHEKMIIRGIHHLTSAAWIEYGYKSGNTDLGSALQGIPKELISDLIDICKFHSKLPINMCDISFTRFPNDRKRLIAAILRLADELDISSNRVNLQTIKDFRIPIENAFYWWLHSYTTIAPKNSFEFFITITLNPDDFVKYADIIRDLYIDGFIKKNDSIISILNNYNYPIKISGNSNIISDNNYDKLPNLIISYLNQQKSPKNYNKQLIDEVLLWLSVLKYEVEKINLIDDRTDELKLILNNGAIQSNLLIRCITGEINISDIEALDENLTKKCPYGWIISETRISPAAYDYVKDKELNIKIFTFSDFLKNQIWRPYYDFICNTIENDKIDKNYVDLSCYKEILDDRGNVIKKDIHSNIDIYIDNWLQERGKNHISLLGEFGSGKTWFCKHYTYRQLIRFFSNPFTERFPLLVTLRDFTKTMKSKHLICNLLDDYYKLPFMGNSFEVFEKLNHEGKLLLILDGFDEMARKTDYQTVVDNFWELANLIDMKSKVILAGRTEYFRWAKESEKILSGEEYGRNILALSPPRFELLYLKSLNSQQIKYIIINQLGKFKGEKFYNKIRTNDNLFEIVRKPILIELIIASLTDVSEKEISNIADIYLYSTNILLLRNIITERTFTNSRDKIFFLCELAWDMISKRELSIHYSQIPDIINNHFREKVKNPHELDNWDFDIRSQSLLHRNSAGYYEFTHKSIAEFFVALKFAGELGLLKTTAKASYTERDGSNCIFPYEEIKYDSLVNTFGKFTLLDPEMHGIRKFLNDLLDQSCFNDLVNVVRETSKTPPDYQYLAGNVFTLIGDNKLDIRNMDFSNSHISGADFSYLEISNSNFDNCVISQSFFYKTNFSDCSIKNSEIRESYLLKTYFKDCSFYSSGLYGNLMVTIGTTDCNFVDTDLSNSSILVQNIKTILDLINNALIENSDIRSIDKISNNVLPKIHQYNSNYAIKYCNANKFVMDFMTSGYVYNTDIDSKKSSELHSVDSLMSNLNRKNNGNLLYRSYLETIQEIPHYLLTDNNESLLLNKDMMKLVAITSFREKNQNII